jgi:2-dehydro-3-deoxygluconokinase
MIFMRRMKVARVVTFGELMLRLSPPGYQRFLQTPAFEATFGGGEANVAVSLARLGIQVAFVTKLPANPIGDAAVGELARHGVETKGIARGGERIGIYYCEKGASQRPSKVVYDRKYSSVSQALKADFDWDEIFAGAEWFHFTGISPAISDSAAEICLEACQKAKAKGIKVSCDLNFRKNLWSSEKAGKVMAGLMPFVELLIANEEDAEKVFGIKAEGTDITSGSLSREGYAKVAEKLIARFGFKKVAITLRGSISASENDWAGMLYEGGAATFSKSYRVHIVDRVGGGDSFGAGLIWAELNGKGAKEAIEIAVAASCLKHSIEGDFNLVGIDEVKALAGGDASGRVQR